MQKIEWCSHLQAGLRWVHTVLRGTGRSRQALLTAEGLPGPTSPFSLDLLSIFHTSLSCHSAGREARTSPLLHQKTIVFLSWPMWKLCSNDEWAQKSVIVYETWTSSRNMFVQSLAWDSEPVEHLLWHSTPPMLEWPRPCKLTLKILKHLCVRLAWKHTEVLFMSSMLEKVGQTNGFQLLLEAVFTNASSLVDVQPKIIYSRSKFFISFVGHYRRCFENTKQWFCSHNGIQWAPILFGTQDSPKYFVLCRSKTFTPVWTDKGLSNYFQDFIDKFWVNKRWTQVTKDPEKNFRPGYSWGHRLLWWVYS